jgi:hypothetical protein
MKIRMINDLQAMPRSASISVNVHVSRHFDRVTSHPASQLNRDSAIRPLMRAQITGTQPTVFGVLLDGRMIRKVEIGPDPSGIQKSQRKQHEGYHARGFPSARCFHQRALLDTARVGEPYKRDR